MRREIVFILVALLLGGAIGTLAVFDRGYVRIEVAGWLMESNFIVFAGLLLLAYFALRWLLRFFSALVNSGTSFRDMLERKRSGKAKARAREGVLLFAAGRWSEAAKKLQDAAGHSYEPVTVWLNAGVAARKAGELEKGRECLEEARKLVGNAPELALLEARWQLEDGEAQKGLATLRDIPQPKDAKLAEQRSLLLARAYCEIEDWSSLSNTLVALRKAKDIDASDYRKFEVALARSSLDALERQASATGVIPAKKEIEGAWKQVPKELRNEPMLVRRKKEVESLAASGVSN